MTLVDKITPDVHTDHCTPYGCKYGSSDCTVTAGQKIWRFWDEDPAATAYSFIYDEDQVRRFHAMLKPLKPGEVYFLSASARNKYLSTAEREFIGLGRTEMFNRKIVKDGTFASFLRVLRSYEMTPQAYLSREGHIIPQKCLVLYANIDPSSGHKALEAFMSKCVTTLFSLHKDPGAIDNLAHLDSDLLTEFQKAHTGAPNLLDIDCDVPTTVEGAMIAQKVIDDLRDHGVTYSVIKTAGGYHILVDRATLKYNYTVVLNQAHTHAQFLGGEVVTNKNRMIPVPGTMAAGFPVQFVDGV